MSLRSQILKCATFILVGACSSSTTGTTTSTGGVFKAKIDGTAWTNVSTAAQASGSGIYIIVGTTLGASPLSMTLTLFNMAAPGTYPIGVTSTVFGGTGAVTSGALAWLTPVSGAAGTLTLTGTFDVGVGF